MLTLYLIHYIFLLFIHIFQHGNVNIILNCLMLGFTMLLPLFFYDLIFLVILGEIYSITSIRGWLSKNIGLIMVAGILNKQ